MTTKPYLPGVSKDKNGAVVVELVFWGGVVFNIGGVLAFGLAARVGTVGSGTEMEIEVYYHNILYLY